MKKIFLNSFVLFFTLYLNVSVYSGVCKIKKDGEKWTIFVDGKKFDLKGVGCGYAEKEGVDYFELAREIGANCVRTWGGSQGTEEYLDKAEKYGLKVDAGLWIDFCYSARGKKLFSYIDEEYKKRKMMKRREIIDYVKKNKDRECILFWNLGNEAIRFAKEEKEKIAVCKFIEDLAREIKKIDSKHPIIYTASGVKEFPYIKKYLKSIDIIGVNVYGSVDYVNEEWIKMGFKKPYIITELGPKGPWDCPKDEFGLSIDYPDYEKAFFYQVLLEEAEKYKNNCLGVFAFYLGNTTQESLTWWNLTVGKYKRESFYVVRKFFTKKTPENYPPYFTKMELDKKKCKPNEKIEIKVSAWDRDKDNLTYVVKIATARENILVHDVNKIIETDYKVEGNKIYFYAPRLTGLYRVHVFVYDGKGNVATRYISFKVH